MILDVGKIEGTILSSEHKMIQNVFEFNDITVGKIMTPASEVAQINLSDTKEKWEKTFFSSGHSVYPVYAKEKNAFVGVIYVKDYLVLADEADKATLTEAIRPVCFAEENTRADILFQEMQKNKTAFCNCYGKTSKDERDCDHQ